MRQDLFISHIIRTMTSRVPTMPMEPRAHSKSLKTTDMTVIANKIKRINNRMPSMVAPLI